jgi:hypothetical protein
MIKLLLLTTTLLIATVTYTPIGQWMIRSASTVALGEGEGSQSTTTNDVANLDVAGRHNANVDQ